MEPRIETQPGLSGPSFGGWSLTESLCLRACLPQLPVSMVTRALWLDLGPTPIPHQPTPPLPLGRECAFILGEQVGGHHSWACVGVTVCDIHDQVMR